MLTIFSTCRPFKEPYATIQANAIGSWTHLTDDVILFGRERGVAEVAQKLGCQHAPDVAMDKQGTPLVSALLDRGSELAKYDMVALVNADIILFSDFKVAAKQVSAWFAKFLMVGRRWDLHRPLPELDFTPGYEGRLRQRMVGGKQHKAGTDYFLFSRDLFTAFNIPAFSMAHYYWDTWLMAQVKGARIPLVDASAAVTALHQPHKRHPLDGPQAKRNLRLSEGSRARIRHATWRITKDGEVVEKHDHES